jgi:hypothetical protein
MRYLVYAYRRDSKTKRGREEVKHQVLSVYKQSMG